jgi:hypothetical protein
MDRPDRPDRLGLPGDRSQVDRGRLALVAGPLALACLLLLGALGDSAAVPGLGARTWSPPWDLAAGAPSWLVAMLSALGWMLAAVAVWAGLRADPASLPSARTLLVGGVVAAGALTLVPPAGSADHLSYVAYGRIAAAGDDAYVVPPADWRGGLDPVAGAVQPPWQHTPSVYGPLATGAFAAVARLGDGSLRLTVWLWSLVCALAFVAVAVLLDRTAGTEAARRRAAVLWTVNPLLLGQLVLGAHVDVLAVAVALGGLLLAARAPAPAGMLLGAAAAIKAPYALFGLAVLWGLRHRSPDQRWRAITGGLFGAALVLVSAHALAGPHVLDQLRTASGFTSIASPWRVVVNLLELGLGAGAMRPVVVPAALVVSVLVAWLLAPRLIGGASASGRDETQDAAAAALLLTVAWTFCAPYALPWYDAMVWAPLALVVGTRSLSWQRISGLTLAVLAHSTVLALAYVPGRVVGLSPRVETITLGFRRFVAPALVLSAVLAALRWARPPARRRPHAP